MLPKRAVLPRFLHLNTRTIDQLMRYFGTAWGKVVAAIQFGQDVMIVAKSEGIFLTSSKATFEMVG